MKSKIYDYLLSKHASYYDTVYYSFIEEAIDNSIRDLGITSYSNANAEKIHKHITQNYI